MTHTLVGIRAENYKRIELVNITFPADGGVVAIMGANEAGKSSLLDALETAIAGKRMPKSDAPVHIGKGAEKATIIATFDDIVVTRTFRKGGGTSIAVKSTDGHAVADASKLLESLYSHVALDPLALSRLSEDERVKTLLPLIGYDPKPIEEERKIAYDSRTVKRREVDSLKNRLAAFPDPEPGLPKAEISLADVSAEIEAAIDHNANITATEAAADAAIAKLDAAVDARKAAEAALAAANEAALAAEEDARIRIAAKVALEAPLDVDALRERISDSERINAAVRTEASRQAIASEHRIAETEHKALEDTIEEIDGRKAKALAAAAAAMPVPGLAISDDENPILMLNGVPFSQASTGVKIKTGTAVAMALNPDLRLIVIRDASLLDQGNRDIIDRLAKDNGFLVLMEIADESSPVGVVIEEGLVREIRTAGEWEASQS